VHTADALDAGTVLGHRRFQRILVDAPCSASGVVRRHPDAKWLRRPGDIARFAQLQERLLDALWRLLEPDGKLLYATCSVFPEENGEVVNLFLGRHDDARRLPVPFTAAGAPDGQMLPTATSDGFYYALMSKNP
jgi:16S rRNA (cytosine967-C5)-methyltransferase